MTDQLDIPNRVVLEGVPYIGPDLHTFRRQIVPLIRQAQAKDAEAIGCIERALKEENA